MHLPGVVLNEGLGQCYFYLNDFSISYTVGETKRLTRPRMWLRVEMILREINDIKMKSRLRWESIELCR
jgi:hypothetical protein